MDANQPTLHYNAVQGANILTLTAKCIHHETLGEC